MIKIYTYLALTVAVVGLLAASHGMAYHAGAASERAARLAVSVEVLRERATINDTMRNADDAALCGRLGGLYIEGKCK